MLAARWTLTDGAGQRSLAAEQATVTEPRLRYTRRCCRRGHALALEKLANRISIGIELNHAQRRRSGLAFVSNLPTVPFLA